MNQKLLKIGQVSKLLNVSTKVLRQWDKDEKLCAVRTPGKQRMYLESDVYRFMGVQKETEEKSDCVLLYSRVSSSEQKTKGDLDRQSNRLVQYSLKNKYNICYVFLEVGSGLSDSRPKLLQTMKLAKEGKINKIIVEHRDRLTRFNFNLIKYYFESHQVKVEYVEETLPKTYEAELGEDMLSLMSSFSAQIDGKRSAERRQKK